MAPDTRVPTRRHRWPATTTTALWALVLASLLTAGCSDGEDDAGTAYPGPTTDPTDNFADNLSPTVEIYVAPGGTGDGTAGNPYGSISDAVNDSGFGPGAAIRLQEGTYSAGHYLTTLAGTANAPIWLGGVPGQNKPVIQDGAGNGMQIVKPNYLVVHDLIIDGADINGLSVDDNGEYANEQAAHHVVFRNLEIRNIGTGGNQDCLKLSGIRHFWVLDCVFENGSIGGSGIDHVGCHDGVIAGCEFTNMGNNSIQCKGGSSNLDIRWNTFTDPGERGVNIGGSTGDTYFRPPLSTTEPNAEARNIHVLSNVFVRGTAPFAFVGAVDCVAAHNTVVDPQNWLMRILQEKTSDATYTFVECSNNSVVNNLFYFQRSALSATDINVGPDTQASTFTFANNLWYAHDDPTNSTPDWPATPTGSIVGTEPGLVAPATGDYHVQTGSPAAGAGTSQTWIAEDRDGNPYENPPTVGAYVAPGP